VSLFCQQIIFTGTRECSYSEPRWRVTHDKAACTAPTCCGKLLVKNKSLKKCFDRALNCTCFSPTVTTVSPNQPVLRRPTWRFVEGLDTVTRVWLIIIILIQFSLFYKAQYHKFWMCLRGLYNLYTYDIPVPGPHIGSRKTPKKFHREKYFRRATEEVPCPGWTEARCHVYRRSHYRVTTHSMNMTMYE